MVRRGEIGVCWEGEGKGAVGVGWSREGEGDGEGADMAEAAGAPAVAAGGEVVVVLFEMGDVCGFSSPDCFVAAVEPVFSSPFCLLAVVPTFSFCAFSLIILVFSPPPSSPAVVLVFLPPSSPTADAVAEAATAPIGMLADWYGRNKGSSLVNVGAVVVSVDVDDRMLT